MNKQTLLLFTFVFAATITVSAFFNLNKPSLRFTPPDVPQYPDIPCLHFSSAMADYWTTPYLYVLKITNTCTTPYYVSYDDGEEKESAGCIGHDGKTHSSPLYSNVKSYSISPC